MREKVKANKKQQLHKFIYMNYDLNKIIYILINKI